MINVLKASGKAFLAVCLVCPQQSFADGFTSADVLEWSADKQDGYFQASVTMIGIVATQTGEHGHIAECIDAWFGGGDASQPQRSARILEVMRGLPDFHPQAVILAVIEKECGDF
ncbi:hypothetical protein [uncultured Roseobacter sp.]|uniref:hypothetical protein n=1 Tax=uncultured Roseobacter sp. TaxID=114847 RepID=UPI00261B2CC1|nr:hypothetical protein [uncultured Roseobacter sp.]